MFVRDITDAVAGHVTQRNAVTPLGMYLKTRYLANNLNHEGIFGCYLHHYASIVETFSSTFILDLHGAGQVIYRVLLGVNTYECRLSVERTHPDEGELTVDFRMNGRGIYLLSFTFVPGLLFGLNERTIVLISRMQGQDGALDAIREATRDFHDVSPQYLLYTIVQGIARGARFARIVGVGSTAQLSHSIDRSPHFEDVYDKFFRAVGLHGPTNQFYVSDTADHWFNRSVSGIKHRSRTKRKRKFKALVAQSIESLPIWSEAPQTPGGDHHHDATGSIRNLILTDTLTKVRRSTIHIDAEQLRTNVGKHNQGGIATTATAGFLCFGPYINLKGGRYRAHFEMNWIGRIDAVEMDVTTDLGVTVIGRKTLCSVQSEDDLCLEFSLKDATDAIEFRLAVGDEAHCQLRAIKLTVL